MGVSHVFKIVQMVPNRAKHHIYLGNLQKLVTEICKVKNGWLSEVMNDVSGRRVFVQQNTA